MNSSGPQPNHKKAAVFFLKESFTFLNETHAGGVARV
jgi:hypothetical protein